MKKWEQLKLDIDAATKAMETTEPKELYDIRHACVGNEAGSYDQEWAPIDFSNGMIRGMTGILLYDGPGWGFDVVSVVCPANQSMPDPGAAVGFLKPLSKLIPGLKVNPQPLMDEADQIQKRMDEQAAENNDLLSRQIYG